MKKTIQILGVFALIWILFVTFIVYRGGLISYYSLSDLFSAVREAKAEKYNEIVRLMDLRDIQSMKTDTEANFIRLNHLGLLRKKSDGHYMWMRDPKNPYFITLVQTGNSWHLIARPTKNSVYLKGFWLRIFTMDFRKLECHSYIYKSGADRQEIIKQTTEPNQALQTISRTVPVAAEPFCGPALEMSDF